MKSLLLIALSGSLLMTSAWADQDAPTLNADTAAASALNPLISGKDADATNTSPNDTTTTPVATTAVPASAMPVARQVQPAKPHRRPPPASRPALVNTITDNEIDRAEWLWEHTGQAAGLIGANGTLTYAYGESRPTIRCAPLHLCVIQFITGEQITDLSIGDSVRWKVAASRAGETPVVVIKPVAIQLETNLTVLTDAGRVYYMTLQSGKSNHVPLVQFYNPQEIIEKISADVRQKQARAKAEQETKDATLGAFDPALLDFNYACTGEASFKPLRVFASTGHVYLQMPADMGFHDFPVLFDQSQDSTQLINSRFARGYVILDGLPEKFKLVVGVDGKAQSVECAHGQNAKLSHNG
jgi:type IV secretion system protein VirB9